MTENEIVQCLKENRLKGVSFKFMPDEVKEWVSENLDNPNLIYLAPDGKWEYFSETDFADCDNIVFALFEDYPIKQESNGEWVEFEIEDSCFAYSHSVGTSHLFDWFDWVFFLKASKKQGWGFTTFGGWRYEGDTGWYMAPCIKTPRNNMWMYIDGKSLPTIPIKIRFWREHYEE